MATLAFSSAGSKLSISAGIPATYNEAGFSALTYTLVNEITSIGAIGPESAVITHQPVSENVTYKLRGSRDNGSLAISGARAPGDPGQALLIAGESSNDPVAIKIELQDGTLIYCQAMVLSYKTNIGGQGQITGFESNVAISGAVFDVEPA